MEKTDTKKVVFCMPTVSKPYDVCLKALEASIPLIHSAGWDESSVWEVGNPYISQARSAMLRKALDAKADVIVFLDHDLSWEPHALLQLIETEGDVVCANYRFKRDPEEYMGTVLPAITGDVQVRDDGCVKAHSVPAGFLKVTRAGINKFITAYPELCYGERCAPSVDLFNHGAWDHVWYGEDFAFSRRYREKCGDIWIIPDLNITHHAGDAAYPGNYHQFLMTLPGGSNDPARTA
jgi:glycosyltransferase involved in cell wall biosynthesis